LSDALSRALLDHGDRLYALALRVTRDPDLAADAVQEAFASALAKQAGFRGDSSIGTWLHRIVYNKAVDLLRSRRRDQPLADGDEEEAGVPPQGAAWSRPPDDVLFARETRAALDRAMGALTPLQRAVFELREVEERPTEEVAEILDLQPGTVRVHLHRARLRLRALLAPHFHGELQ
jgi:RNA polymerase sigma-70 factor (ECF subfamily)